MRLIITNVVAIEQLPPTEDGDEFTPILIALRCTKCGYEGDIQNFGVRKMSARECRSQAQCIACRKKSGPWTKGRK